MEQMRDGELSQSKYLKRYILSIGHWTITAMIIGVICGFVGALFYNGVHYATDLRGEYPWLLYLLPVAGVLIVFIYRRFGTEGLGTDTIIDSVQESSKVKAGLIPSIFIGTILTHLCGGSSGREGAALQIGGGIGSFVGTQTRMKGNQLRIATMTGMAAFFAAIFGTPLTATIFVVMVINVGHVYEMAVLPCFVSSWTALWISSQLGVQPFQFRMYLPNEEPVNMLRVIVLAALCGLVSILMCKTFHAAHHLYEKYFENPYIRVIVGGCLVILLTFAVGTRDYNGAGSNVIRLAVEEGVANPEAFLLKILFTAVTLGAGFKGGEIVPTFFIGSTFGCVVGPLLGIQPRFAAAIGLIAVFAGATNTLIAPIFLAVEAYGVQGVQFFALASMVAYICSGYGGLYSRQKIMYSKVRATDLDIRTGQNRVVKTHSVAAYRRLARKKRKKK